LCMQPRIIGLVDDSHALPLTVDLSSLQPEKKLILVLPTNYPQ
jgi:hypothetical protein